MAACKHVIQLGARSRIDFTKSDAILGSLWPRFECRHSSQLVKPNGKHAFLVDTLALVRNFLSNFNL